MLRIWRFKNVDGNKAFTSEGRAEIVSRERVILERINHQNRDLYNHCLRSPKFQKDEVTASTVRYMSYLLVMFGLTSLLESIDILRVRPFECH